jgi:hypothetical protein
MNDKSLYNDNFDLEEYKILLDAYCTHLIANKNDIKNIKDIRMNTIITYYIEIMGLGEYSIYDYIDYYKNNVVDNFNYKLNPPQCPFYIFDRIERESKERERIEEDTDDINFHYKNIENKYNYYGNIENKSISEDNYSDIEMYFDDDSTEYSYTDDEYGEYSSYDYEDDYNQNDVYDNDDYISDDEYYY